MATSGFFQGRALTSAVRVVDARSAVSTLVQGAVVVDRSASVGEAASLMRSASVSALLVGDRDGIVTERDLTRALAAGFEPRDALEPLVTRHPITVPGSTSVLEAAELMLGEDVRHLVVELDGDAVGVVSIREVLAVLVQAVDPQLWLASLRIVIGRPVRVPPESDPG